MSTIPGSNQILHFPLDQLSRSYSHFSRLLRVLRGLSASSIISVFGAIFYPFAVYIFFSAGLNFAFFVLGLFFDVAQESILSPEDLSGWLNIVYYSRIGLLVWLCFVLPLSILAGVMTLAPWFCCFLQRMKGKNSRY